MSLKNVGAGKNLPCEINVIIEIPMNGGPVKYEVDKESGTLHVDRFMATSMNYPANYGFIPNTLSLDGDPVDVLVLTPVPLLAGSVIACRVIGVLKMTDESGVDAKLLAVPVDKLCKLYKEVESYQDLPEQMLKVIEHFFEHYKDLEAGKWVKVEGWDGIEVAHQEILDSVARFEVA